MGFEPTDGGFADLSLRPLGYRAEVKKYSETAVRLSVAARSQKVLISISHAYLDRWNITRKALRVIQVFRGAGLLPAIFLIPTPYKNCRRDAGATTPRTIRSMQSMVAEF